jgi:hypothetical protein
MIRMGLAAVVAAAALSHGCAGGGTFGASATVSVSAEIQLPIAEMPPKYASWVVEAEGYLLAVDEAYERHMQAKADLAAVFGIEADADAIASFIRDAIQVETTLICQPPSVSASLVADCRAEANARAAGNAGGGQAHAESSAGIEANCEARGRLSLRPGSCTLETTVSEHPILSDPDKWARAEASMKVILQLSAANVHLDGRGGDINARGLQLYVESVTDLAGDPTLVLQLDNIQAELERGSDAAGEANDKQRVMNRELGRMTSSIDSQFPDLRASISAG